MATVNKARLIGIAVRPPGTREMRELPQAAIDEETGLVGDKRSRPGRRQVTLMSQAAWQQVCAELGETLPWTVRRANLLVDQLPLFRTTGGRIRIGEVELEITGETDPCNKMETARTGLFEALRPGWRGGVTCRVLRGGELVVGEDVELVTA
jgi:MOSC domain-containing protein YiiM